MTRCSFRSLDEEGPLAAALSDPGAFAAFGDRPRIIDEVQRGGDSLVRAIKYEVDRDNHRGQFVLSGSTRFLTVPTLSESLAGRAAFVDIWPFTVSERVGSPDDIGYKLVTDPASLMLGASSQWARGDYLDLICVGGYPEAVAFDRHALRSTWFQGYLRTVIQRDVRQFADIEHSAVVPRLLALVAARAGSTVVVNGLGKTVNLDQKTVSRYLSYLDTVFLTIQVPAWSTNLSSKVAKSSRIFLSDPGLAAYLMGVARSRCVSLATRPWAPLLRPSSRPS